MVRWQRGVHANTFRKYQTELSNFCAFTGKNPDELVAWGIEQGKNGEKFAVLEAIESYVQEKKHLRYRTLQYRYSAIRSFMLHNRVELPRDPAFHIRSETPPVERQLSVENLRELVGLAVQPWRSMILAKWQGILDTESLIYISNNHAESIVKALRADADIVKLSMPGRKRKRNIQTYCTFLGGDALKCLREYFERDRGWPKTGESVWIYASRY